MRSKQTKPQHVWKAEGEEANGIHSDSDESAQMQDEDLDWDCVDGDIAAVPRPAIAVESHAPENGLIMEMDLAPMLALYTKVDTSGADDGGSDVLDEAPLQAAAENDVIIQGRRPIFSEAEEFNIASQLKTWKDQGMKYTRLDVVKMASEYAVQLGKRPQGRPLTVKWFRSFLTRHPECYIRKSRKIKSERPEKQHFNHLDTILSSHNIKESPHCIFSLVELPMSMLMNGEFVAPEDLTENGVNGSKENHKLIFEGKVPSSILFCGSAAGQALPPFLIYPSKNFNKLWMAGVTPGTGGVASPSGRATSEVLVSFLREHFLSQAPGRAGETLVLLVDANIGHCLNQAILDLGSAFKLVFVTAQTSLNPQLHPMVVGCCNTFHREFCFELQKPLYASEPASLSSSSICEFLCRLYHRHMSAENLHSTFKKAGIYPFNPSICRKRYGSAVLQSPGSLGCPSKKATKEAKTKPKAKKQSKIQLSGVTQLLDDSVDIQ